MSKILSFYAILEPREIYTPNDKCRTNRLSIDGKTLARFPHLNSTLALGNSMTKIETDGFLSEESENGKSQILEKYEDAFNFAGNLNRFCMTLLDKLNIDWKNNFRLIVNTLILRVVENFQAVYLMLERGMLIPSKVLTRANLETLFILAGLQKNPNLLQCYLDQYDEGHKRSLRAALQFKNESLKASVKEIDIEKLYIKKKKELKNKELNILKPKQWAIEAGLEDFYNLYYIMYSNAIHSNLSALNDHVDDLRQRLDLSFGPSDKELYEIMQCNFYILINSLRATSLVNNIDISKEIDGFANEIRSLDKKYIETMS